MKTSLTTLIVIATVLGTSTLLAGPGPGSPRAHRAPPPDAAIPTVTVAKATTCPTMLRRTGRFTRRVECSGAIAQTATCQIHCRNAAGV